MQSVVAAFLAWGFLGETLEVSTYAGGGVVVLGLLVVVWCRYIESQRAEAARDSKSLLLDGEGEGEDVEAELLGWSDSEKA